MGSGSAPSTTIFSPDPRNVVRIGVDPKTSRTKAVVHNEHRAARTTADELDSRLVAPFVSLKIEREFPNRLLDTGGLASCCKSENKKHRGRCELMSSFDPR